MDFRFDDEATAIAELAGTVLTDYSAPEQLRELERSGAPRFDRELWGKLAETGILGAFVPESAGGAGLGLLALGAALEQAGRTTAAVPLWETLALGALPIAEFAPEALATEVLGPAAYLDRTSVGSVLRGRLEMNYRSLLILTFGGGTNEIQRDLIGMFGLGLPRALRS
jgi:alkylation response protein AidB-like acyl-CoA dehydrogenase